VKLEEDAVTAFMRALSSGVRAITLRCGSPNFHVVLALVTSWFAKMTLPNSKAVSARQLDLFHMLNKSLRTYLKSIGAQPIRKVARRILFLSTPQGLFGLI
jgi:hypothetical protein